MNNPGIDLAIWEQLRKKWSELERAGHKLKIDFHLIADVNNGENVLAIDVIQNINDDVITETVQQKTGEANAKLGIAGLSMEQIIEVYKKMMKQLHREFKQRDADLIVTMSPTSPASGEVRGYLEKPNSEAKHYVAVDYRHYYVLNALRERMIELVGNGWSKVRAVYRSGNVEFHFEY